MKRLHFLILILILTSLNSCKKDYEKRHPEDTENTYDTPFERLGNKWWRLDSVTFNGINYTDTVYDSIGEYYFYMDTKIYDKGGLSPHKEGLVNIEKPIIGSTGFVMVWGLIDDDTNIGFGDRDGVFQFKRIVSFTPLLFYTNGNIRWNILKLTNSELKISVKTHDTVIVNYFSKL